MQKFKIDLACVRAQSVTSYQVATFTGCGLGGQLHQGIRYPLPAWGSGCILGEVANMTDSTDAELARLSLILRDAMRDVADKETTYHRLQEGITATVDRSGHWPSTDDEREWPSAVVEEYVATVHRCTETAGLTYKRACAELTAALEKLDAVVEAIMATKPTSICGLAIWAAALRDAYGELWRQPSKALEYPDDLLRRFIDQIIAMAAETQPGLIVPAVMLTNAMERSLADMECPSAAAN